MKLKSIILWLLIIFYIIFYYISFSNSSERIFYDSSDKLWAHRVLNIDEVNVLSKDFQGVELDVFFNLNDKCFEIKHHEPHSNINLNEYFSSTDSILSLKFWIDFKNLNSENVDSSLSLLNRLCDNYKIESNLIIESKDIVLLDKFKNNGFYISYWLPNFHFIGSVFNILEVKNNLLKYQPDAISMPYSSVSFYSRKFPNYPIHCWTNDMIQDKDKIKIRNLGKINNVKIVLTDFKENFLK